MDSKIKKWIMVMLAVLVISAAAAGFMPEWKKTSAIGKGKDYVAEIRIDGTTAVPAMGLSWGRQKAFPASR